MNALKSTLNKTLFASAFVASCATMQVAPSELVDARQAVYRAQSGPAKKYSPTQVYVAEQSLNSAEAEFKERGDTQKTRDLAYVAQRKAELAEAQAVVVRLSANIHSTSTAAVATTASAGALAQKSAATTSQSAQLARAQADWNAKNASLWLQEQVSDNSAGSVEETSRGTIVKFHGYVLFHDGESLLLPSGQTMLSHVSDMLKTNKRNFVVEAHVNADGSAKEAFNRDLTLSQAQAVRNYIVSQGVDTERGRAVGIGSARPIADNSTIVGRAQNRRVEIVIQPAR